MPRRVQFMVLAGWLAAVASVPADVVWSGDMYQRAYHDISSIDMNQDGTNDFAFRQEVVPGGDTYYEYFIEPDDGQIVVEQRTLSLEPISLQEGTLISSDLQNSGVARDLVWQGSETVLFIYGTVFGTPNYGGLGGEGYVGVSFDAGGATHYGWIKTSHDENRPNPDDQFLYIHGWAYETTPDTPIVAGAIPEPSTGILTMVGSLALLQLARSRRRRRQDTEMP